MRRREILLIATTFLAGSIAASEMTRRADSSMGTILVDGLSHHVTNRERQPISLTITTISCTNLCQAEISVRGSSSER